MLKELISWLKAAVIALIIVFVVREFAITPSVVKGDSMQPNLHDGDRIIISKLSSIDRFDEIAFVAPNGNDNYVKRVIGLPGDRIEINNDILYINDVVYDEFYLAELGEHEILVDHFDLEEWHGYEEVPEDTYFVMGDNRRYSYDSRDFGVITEESVIGEVVFRIWPLDSIGMIRN